MTLHTKVKDSLTFVENRETPSVSARSIGSNADRECPSVQCTATCSRARFSRWTRRAPLTRPPLQVESAAAGWSSGGHARICLPRWPVHKPATSRSNKPGTTASSKALVHARRSTFVRIERGIYRFRRWPDAECERHAVTWLWAKRLGMDAVFSHETALRLYGLWPMTTSPTETLRLTLPLTCSLRRLRRPWGVQLSFERLGPSERTCVGSIPVVRVGVALDQLCREGADMESMSEAYARGRARGLVSAREVALAHLLESHLAQRRGSEHAPLHRGTRSAIQDAVQAVG